LGELRLAAEAGVYHAEAYAGEGAALGLVALVVNDDREVVAFEVAGGGA
jgi:hypothetical protein